MGNCHKEIDTEGHLLLRQEKLGEVGAFLMLKSYPRFDGTMKDVNYFPAHSQSQGINNVLIRSDASLLAGLAFRCQEQGDLEIETMQVMLHQNDKKHSLDGNIPEKLRRVAFVITISLPRLNDSKEKGIFKKGMSSSTRLLFSLLRSDWEYLNERYMKRALLKVHSESNPRIQRERFFPPRMTLEELYKRIRYLQAGKDEPLSTQMTDSACMLLPSEVLRDNIASFLRARSLYSFRVTCRHIYQSLKSVIPGLGLRLYAHQV
eukprot:CAMPEP_0194239674 /NCGR_PEP_ID=MMETSP0158-20130606/6067_1 /TAXON_ID=33649 /ORGANISM="Thalassionema nitzschioides, Strain L26-B" /LENGTH=261 /DNA_ID=CAMNT_0038974199 /DNA_START=217 /DNA_END=999 /DNA_ORIENTATION=-